MIGAVKVTLALKCYEKNNFVCKRNQSFTQDCKCNATYDNFIILPGYTKRSQYQNLWTM